MLGDGMISAKKAHYDRRELAHAVDYRVCLLLLLDDLLARVLGHAGLLLDNFESAHQGAGMQNRVHFIA